ncbi:hypothetical protein PTKIN_Ptkin05aG0041000 [Pterospermum kingtungense]
MKLVCSLTPARIILSVVALLVLKSLSTWISKHCNLEFSISPVSLFILFNAITVAVIVGSHKPSSIDEFDGVYSYLCSLYEVGASFDDSEECSDVYVFQDDTCGSDGYHEDDDDDDDMDDSLCDEEYDDDDLQKRIEDFIAKVNNGWREERLKEEDGKQEEQETTGLFSF